MIKGFPYKLILLAIGLLGYCFPTQAGDHPVLDKVVAAAVAKAKQAELTGDYFIPFDAAIAASGVDVGQNYFQFNGQYADNGVQRFLYNYNDNRQLAGDSIRLYCFYFYNFGVYLDVEKENAVEGEPQSLREELIAYTQETDPNALFRTLYSYLTKKINQEMAALGLTKEAVVLFVWEDEYYGLTQKNPFNYSTQDDDYYSAGNYLESLFEKTYDYDPLQIHATYVNSIKNGSIQYNSDLNAYGRLCSDRRESWQHDKPDTINVKGIVSDFSEGVNCLLLNDCGINIDDPEYHAIARTLYNNYKDDLIDGTGAAAGGAQAGFDFIKFIKEINDLGFESASGFYTEFQFIQYLKSNSFNGNASVPATQNEWSSFNPFTTTGTYTKPTFETVKQFFTTSIADLQKLCQKEYNSCAQILQLGYKFTQSELLRELSLPVRKDIMTQLMAEGSTCEALTQSHDYTNTLKYCSLLRRAVYFTTPADEKNQIPYGGEEILNCYFGGDTSNLERAICIAFNHINGGFFKNLLQGLGIVYKTELKVIYTSSAPGNKEALLTLVVDSESEDHPGEKVTTEVEYVLTSQTSKEDLQKWLGDLGLSIHKNYTYYTFCTDHPKAWIYWKDENLYGNPPFIFELLRDVLLAFPSSVYGIIYGEDMLTGAQYNQLDKALCWLDVGLAAFPLMKGLKTFIKSYGNAAIDVTNRTKLLGDIATIYNTTSSVTKKRLAVYVAKANKYGLSADIGKLNDFEVFGRNGSYYSFDEAGARFIEYDLQGYPTGKGYDFMDNQVNLGSTEGMERLVVKTSILNSLSPTLKSLHNRLVSGGMKFLEEDNVIKYLAKNNEEIARIENGVFTVSKAKLSIPEPTEYLNASYITSHINKFKQEGGAFVIRKSELMNPKYTSLAPRKFVGLKSEMDLVLDKYNSSGKNQQVLIDELDLGSNYFDRPNDEIYYVIVEPDKGLNFDMPTGNEGGAYEGFWVPGGYTKHGTAEAVISNSGDFPHNNSMQDFKNIFGSSNVIKIN